MIDDCSSTVVLPRDQFRSKRIWLTNYRVVIADGINSAYGALVRVEISSPSFALL